MAAAMASSFDRRRKPILPKILPACRPVLSAGPKIPNGKNWILAPLFRPAARSGWKSVSAAASIWSIRAARNPDVGLIGAEPFINGVAMLLGKIRAAELGNLRIYPGDVRDLFDVLPERSIDRAFLLYPDPWPKKKHHRRRFVTPGFLDPLARVMKPGAFLRIATDIPDYVRQALEELTRHPSFKWTAETARDWREPWPDGPAPATKQRPFAKAAHPII